MGATLQTVVLLFLLPHPTLGDLAVIAVVLVALVVVSRDDPPR